MSRGHAAHAFAGAGVPLSPELVCKVGAVGQKLRAPIKQLRRCGRVDVASMGLNPVWLEEPLWGDRRSVGG